MNYTIVFFTHSGAIKFEKKMIKMNISCLLQPVPRKLSSSCGICARINYDGSITDLIESEIESIYKDISKNQYERMYDSHSA
ncbi:hypothetical protein SDC9_68788 [bioreactor metagenome]|jgi:hypothetical protein|uniref:Uncharacterized protein DUF3343 n=2 Tax=root TaxID=1 RepID=A0A562JBM3_9FIRM|nr:DUF3343 domain-containing protein [Sedimentibacter saalensis]MEA5093942.1 DUF3343 domain-containing protein [Sedimentibacter saalensis]TWH80557.1 uncharacterized protein DUF3343 [Sedimentibacter saalensis]